MTTHAKATYDREPVDKLVEAVREAIEEIVGDVWAREHLLEALAEWEERDDNARQGHL